MSEQNVTTKKRSEGAQRRSREIARDPTVRGRVQRRNELEVECRRAADVFLSLGWGSAESRVGAVVEEMVANARLRRESVAWLLEQVAGHPLKREPVRRLNELATLINALRLEKGSRRSLY